MEAIKEEKIKNSLFISGRRIGLLDKEYDDCVGLEEYKERSADGSSSDLSIVMKNSSFSWPVLDSEDSSVTETPALTGLSLEVTRGRLVGVAGGVGAGKSSLISALLGEVRERLETEGRHQSMKNIK